MSDEPTEIDINGTQIWMLPKSKWHRDNDLPAVIRTDGYCAWYQNGELHRDNNLPAVIWPDGWCEWYQDGWLVKQKRCIQEGIKEWKKPHIFQKNKNIKFNRFEKLIK